jgi:hypothetical protein
VSLIWGAAPQQLHYQGYLVDGAEEAVDCSDPFSCDTSFNFSFRLYDAPFGGTLIWEEDHAALPVYAGVFHLVLGDSFPINPSFLDGPRWLGVEVNELGEMSPRQRLTSAAYALRSAHADAAADATTLGGSSVETFVQVTDIPDLCVTSSALEDILDAEAYCTTCYTNADVQALLDGQGYTPGPGFSGNFGDLTGVPTGLADGDDNTQLTEAEVDAFVANNNYAIGAHTTDTDTQLTEAEVDAFVANNGYALTGALFSGDYNDLTNLPTLPSGVTSVDGLSGGTIEGDVVINGSLSLTEKTPLIERSLTSFSAGILQEISLSGSEARPTLRLAPSSAAIDLGNGSDGVLVVTSGTHTDDGTLKQYSSVTIADGATVRVASWGGSSGGTIDWKVQTTVQIANGASIDVTASGYRGASVLIAGNTSVGGHDGESFNGTGDTSTNNNDGGGGAADQTNTSVGAAGGGGGYGSFGETRAELIISANGQGGQPYGDAELTILHLGSGGGTGGCDDNGLGPRSLGPAGNGGGAIRIRANAINVLGSIKTDGQDGTASACLTGSCGSADDGGSGGGSGGSVHLIANELNIQGSITAVGGAGGNGHHDTSSTSAGAINYRGGAGGDGRIRLDSAIQTGTGSVTPAAGFTETLSPSDFASVTPVGTFTSQVHDSGAPTQWGTMDWEVYGQPYLEIRVRSGDAADLSDAVAIGDAAIVTRGQDLSTLSSVSDGHRYIQYQLTLVNDPALPGGPVVTAVVINRE